MANHSKGNHWKVRKWKPEDTEFLKENYKTLGPAKCARILNAPQPTVLYHAKLLGLRNRHAPTSRPWTPDDDLFLEENCGTMTYAEMADILNRSQSAVNARIKRIRDEDSTRIPKKVGDLPDDQIEKIEKLYNGGMPDAEIARQIQRSSHVVNRYRIINNLPPNGPSHAKWSPAEITFLLENYGKLSGLECMKHLPGRSLYAIQKKAHHLRKKSCQSTNKEAV